MSAVWKELKKLLPSILPILAAIVVGVSQAAQSYISAHPVQGFSGILVAVVTHWIDSPRQ